MRSPDRVGVSSDPVDLIRSDPKLPRRRRAAQPDRGEVRHEAPPIHDIDVFSLVSFHARGLRHFVLVARVNCRFGVVGGPGPTVRPTACGYRRTVP